MDTVENKICVSWIAKKSPLGSGQGLIEYALIILLVVIGVIAVLGLLGIELKSLYQFISDSIPI